MSFAKTILVGNLGRDVTLRYMPNGTAVADFSVAVSEKFKKDGETQEKTYWWKCTSWGRQAEVCNQYLAKGSSVYLEGRPGYEEYVSRDGDKRFNLTLNVSDVQFLGSKRDSDDTASTPDVRQAVNSAAERAQAPSHRTDRMPDAAGKAFDDAKVSGIGVDESDIPF